jgi:hypothetical protein
MLTRSFDENAQAKEDKLVRPLFSVVILREIPSANFRRSYEFTRN